MRDLPLMSVGMQYGLCRRSRGIVRAGHPAAAEYDNTFREMQELLSVAWPYVDPDVAVVAFGRYG